tara:strand:+ start:59 stop:730 length:672 start_codon:yes stop_codon:yes gene_type:complete
MSNTTIHYINANYTRFDHSLVRQTDLDDGRFAYDDCPVFNHKRTRTFLGISPIDFNIKVNRNSKEIICTDPDLVEGDNAHYNSSRAVLQLKFPRFIFWTHDNDVWFEFCDHPMTSLNNNFIAVSGWFNLSNWSRCLSLAITIVDEEKPIIIKKGDPLFRVFFYPSDLNNSIDLKQEMDPNKINCILEEHTNKHNYGRITKFWKPKLFSKTNSNSKCPFSFLFK